MNLSSLQAAAASAIALAAALPGNKLAGVDVISESHTADLETSLETALRTDGVAIVIPYPGEPARLDNQRRGVALAATPLDVWLAYNAAVARTKSPVPNPLELIEAIWTALAGTPASTKGPHQLEPGNPLYTEATTDDGWNLWFLHFEAPIVISGTLT